MTAYADTAAGARALIETETSDRLRDYLTTGIDGGELALIPDPAVAGVWGVRDLVAGSVVAVLYLTEGDFEAADSLPI